MRQLLAVILLLLLSSPAMAQMGQPDTPLPRQRPVESVTQDTTDVPVGAPYRTGDAQYRTAGDPNPSVMAQASVPLRDYLSSRIDNLRSEMLDKLETLERAQTKLQDERDRQYSQRFSSQQDAVFSALQAAKEAVTKAETAADKRFDSVNEFRQTLAEQAEKFMSKDTGDAKFEAIDKALLILNEKASVNASRLDLIKAAGEGAGALWGYILGGVGLLMMLATFAMNISRRTILK